MTADAHGFELTYDPLGRLLHLRQPALSAALASPQAEGLSPEPRRCQAARILVAAGAGHWGHHGA